MKKCFLAATVALAAATCGAAQAEERLVAFKGGIGVVPVSNGVVPQGSSATTLVVETVTRNVVRNTPPGGQPWVIADLRADVRTDSTVRVDGRGLLLGGSANIGRNGGQSVRARLFCNGTAPTFADNSVHNSELVPLEPNGDFRIEGELTPAVPAECANAVLLIVSSGGNWFAAGIPKD